MYPKISVISVILKPFIPHDSSLIISVTCSHSSILSLLKQKKNSTINDDRTHPNSNDLGGIIDLISVIQICHLSTLSGLNSFRYLLNLLYYYITHDFKMIMYTTMLNM